MDGSFYTADRATYRRVVLTALAAATLVMAISLAARGMPSNALAAASHSVTKSIPVVAPAANKLACNATYLSGGCRFA
jgi:hypothetical protein